MRQGIGGSLLRIATTIAVGLLVVARASAMLPPVPRSANAPGVRTSYRASDSR